MALHGVGGGRGGGQAVLSKDLSNRTFLCTSQPPCGGEKRRGGGASYEALLGFMAVYLEEALADRECQSIHFFLGNRWMPQLAKDDLVDASFIDTLYPGMRHVALLEGDEEEALRVSAPVLLEQGSAAAVLGRGGGGNGVGGAAAWRRCRLLGVVSAAAAVLGALWGVGTE